MAIYRTHLKYVSNWNLTKSYLSMASIIVHSSCWNVALYSTTEWLPWSVQIFILEWHYNEHDGVSNHQPHDCLLNRLFRRRSRKKIKAPRHWPLCGEFTGDQWIPRTNSSAENVSICWRHHIRRIDWPSKKLNTNKFLQNFSLRIS